MNSVHKAIQTKWRNLLSIPKVEKLMRTKSFLLNENEDDKCQTVISNYIDIEPEREVPTDEAFLNDDLLEFLEETETDQTDANSGESFEIVEL